MSNLILTVTHITTLKWLRTETLQTRGRAIFVNGRERGACTNAALEALKAAKPGNSDGWVWDLYLPGGKTVRCTTIYALRAMGLVETKSSGLHQVQMGGAYSKKHWTSDLGVRLVTK